MKKLAHFSLLIFFSVSILDLCNVWFALPYREFTKSLIIPALLLYFISTTPKSSVRNLFIVALIFAWLGDVFLLFSGSTFFLLGLGSFLIMQVLYTVVFLRNKEFRTLKVLISSVALLGFSIGFNYYLWPFVSEMRIPVIVYSIAIAMMAFFGINRLKVLNGYLYIVYGVILFVISDTVLAINNFADGFWQGGFVVMLTYILAQYFIVEGYAKHLRSLVK